MRQNRCSREHSARAAEKPIFQIEIMRNKRALITGVNSGLGKACAMQLAQMDWEFIMLCRSRKQVILAKILFTYELARRLGGTGVAALRFRRGSPARISPRTIRGSSAGLRHFACGGPEPHFPKWEPVMSCFRCLHRSWKARRESILSKETRRSRRLSHTIKKRPDGCGE